jgi:DNA polymerase-4
MECPTSKLNFNPISPSIMHLDINSCFATIEQQANPLLRGKPLAVAAYNSPSGCIVAPSIEAKKLGIKVGMRVKDGKALCPSLIIVTPDPWKYRNVHLSLRKLLNDYSSDVTPKSIDEFVVNLTGFPVTKSKTMLEVGREIKERIKKEIGDWMTVSIGIAPNRFLAKVASSLHKPDGLDEINKDNYLSIYKGLKLTDLCGIKLRSAVRLNYFGIYTVSDFHEASARILKAAFGSVNGYYWYFRLRGWEVDDVFFARRSYGNSYALPKPLVSPQELSPIISKLTQKMAGRLRAAGYKARGIHLAVTYRDGSFWHEGKSLPNALFDSRDFYKGFLKLLMNCPERKPVREIFVSAFNLLKGNTSQLEMFSDVEKKERMVKAIDAINERWGSFVVSPARMMDMEKQVLDRIAFGGVKELEEFTLNS